LRVPILKLSRNINDNTNHANIHDRAQTMDPFSILTGTAGLLDVSFRVIGYLKQVEEEAGTVEEEIAALSQEINALITVHDSIEALWRSNHDAAPVSPLEEGADVEDLWGKLASLLQECRDTVQKLEALLKEVIGKN